MEEKIIAIGNFNIGNQLPLVIFAGPCAIQSEDHAMKMAEALKKEADRQGISLVYKSSFDKANRTSFNGGRGVGLQEGLKILQRVKQSFDVPILTDIHQPDQAAPVAEVADILQIPAFLCRQTDLLLAAGKTGRAINVKKGQFLAPWDMAHVAEKIASTGNKNIMLCERGTSFGYNTLVVDITGLAVMKEAGYPVVMDATHAVQQPGGKGQSSGGNRAFAPLLARAAVSNGVACVFMEVNDHPEKSPSDAENTLRLEKFPQLLEDLKTLDTFAKKTPYSLSDWK